MWISMWTHRDILLQDLHSQEAWCLYHEHEMFFVFLNEARIIYCGGVFLSFFKMRI